MTDVLCKNCSQECTIKSSKSEKNPGRDYYACPSGCKGAWNGWVDDDSAASAAPQQQVSSSNPKCKSCKAPCIERQSNTDKNRGRKFWACQKQCKIWNGWLSDTPAASTSTDTSSKSAPVPTTKPATTKRVAESAPTTSTKPMIKLPKIAHYCQDCDKILDIDHEIDNNVSRYSGTLKYPREILRLHLKSELQEVITSGEYTCEACLGNE
jgi:hypothetical protein